MRVKKSIAILAIVAATGLFAGMSTIDGLITEMNQTTDEAKKSQLMRKIDQELAGMNKEDRAKAVALIRVKLKEPMAPSNKPMKGKEKG